MRTDSLSLMLSLANVHAGARGLVVDDIGGLLVGSVLDRMGGQGVVLAFNEHVSPGWEYLRFMNLSSAERAIQLTVPWGLLALRQEDDEQRLQHCVNPNRRGHLERQLEQRRCIRSELERGQFDFLLIASKYDPMSVVQVLAPYLAGSRPVVVYGQTMMDLESCFRWMRQQKYEQSESGVGFLDVRMCENILRPYQVLSERTHPKNNMISSGGYVLSGITVLGPTQEQ